MSDRVSASIVVGGTLSASDYAELAEIIAGEGLSTEWDGETFEPSHRSYGEPLRLFAHEVAWGRFEELETWCLAHHLPFARWAGGYSGSFGPERLVSPGDGSGVVFAVTEDDEVVIDRPTAERLGSLEAILAHFRAADVAVPPLVVVTESTDAVATSANGGVYGQ